MRRKKGQNIHEQADAGYKAFLARRGLTSSRSPMSRRKPVKPKGIK